MLKGLTILFSWLILGFSIDLIWANWNYVPNTSMSINTFWLTVALYLSLIHCFFIKVKNKSLSYSVLLPSGLLVILVSEYFYDFYQVEKNCKISEVDSLVAAVNYLKKIKYDPKYLTETPDKLDWCKLGFVYESPDHYRLVIVSEDGSVRLND